LDELSRDTHKIIQTALFCKLHIFIEEQREVIASKLELWSQTLDKKKFYLNESKKDYMECNFIGKQRENN